MLSPRQRDLRKTNIMAAALVTVPILIACFVGVQATINLGLAVAFIVFLLKQVM